MHPPRVSPKPCLTAPPCASSSDSLLNYVELYYCHVEAGGRLAQAAMEVRGGSEIRKGVTPHSRRPAAPGTIICLNAENEHGSGKLAEHFCLF